MPLEPRLSFSETNYLKVAASTIYVSIGAEFPAGESHAVYKFRANGADPAAYVVLAWDWGGDAQKIFGSTKGDIEIIFETDNPDHIITGVAGKKLSIVIINDNTDETPIVGGEFETVKVG